MPLTSKGGRLVYLGHFADRLRALRAAQPANVENRACPSVVSFALHDFSQHKKQNKNTQQSACEQDI